MSTLLLLAGLFLAPARGGAAESELTQGRRFFNQVCAACHYQHGRGKSGMGRKPGTGGLSADLTSPRVQKRTDAELIKLLTKGIGKMPGYKGEHRVSSAAVRGVVAYLRILAAAGPLPDGDLPNAKKPGRGEAVYLKSCAPCHGRHGGGIFKPLPSPPPSQDTGVVDLRGAVAPAPRRAAPRPPLLFMEVDETKLTEEELESFTGHLRKLEKKRHGYSIDEELNKDDILALERYLDRMERDLFPDTPPHQE